MLDTLRNLGEFLAGVRGRRKAVLLFSEGLEMPMSEIYGMHTPTDVGGAIKDAITAAARSNVNFFALDPRGLIGLTTEFIELAGSGAPDVAMGVFGSQNAQQGLLTDIRLSQDSLRTLAEETGGFAAVNQNTLGLGLRAHRRREQPVLRARLLPADHRRATAGSIASRCARSGQGCACRRAAVTPRRAAARLPSESATKRHGGRARPDAAASTTRRPSCATRSMRRCSRAASPSRSRRRHSNYTQKEASVALAIEFDGEPLPFTPPDSGGLVTNTIELSFFGINQDGKAQRSTRSQFNLTLRPESFTRVKAGGLRVNPRLTLEPGRYQIRVGARETVGSRVGTVFYDLQVPDFRKEPLMLSGVLITAASAQAAMTAMPDPAAQSCCRGPRSAAGRSPATIP